MTKNLASKTTVSEASSTDKKAVPFSAGAAAAAGVFTGEASEAGRVMYSDAELDGLKPLLGDDLVRTKVAPLSFVWNGFVDGSVGCLVAPGSTGKSFFALEAAIEVVAPDLGKNFLNLGVRHCGSVALFNAEDDEQVVRTRMHACTSLIPKEFDKNLQNLNYYALRGMQPNIADERWLSRVSRWSEGKKLVIFDTLTRWHRADENSNDQMSEVLGYFELLSSRTGAAVLFLHHVNKSSARDGAVDEQQSSRGAAAITDNCRWQGFLQTLTKKEAEKLKIADDIRKQFVSFGGAKENYGQATNLRWYKRAQGGVLLSVDLEDYKTTKKSGDRYDK